MLALCAPRAARSPRESASALGARTKALRRPRGPVWSGGRPSGTSGLGSAVGPAGRVCVCVRIVLYCTMSKLPRGPCRAAATATAGAQHNSADKAASRPGRAARVVAREAASSSCHSSSLSHRRPPARPPPDSALVGAGCRSSIAVRQPARQPASLAFCMAADGLQGGRLNLIGGPLACRAICLTIRLRAQRPPSPPFWPTATLRRAAAADETGALEASACAARPEGAGGRAFGAFGASGSARRPSSTCFGRSSSGSRSHSRARAQTHTQTGAESWRAGGLRARAAPMTQIQLGGAQSSCARSTFGPANLDKHDAASAADLNLSAGPPSRRPDSGEQSGGAALQVALASAPSEPTGARCSARPRSDRAITSAAWPGAA